jgi:hypothetical protein
LPRGIDAVYHPESFRWGFQSLDLNGKEGKEQGDSVVLDSLTETLVLRNKVGTWSQIIINSPMQHSHSVLTLANAMLATFPVFLSTITRHSFTILLLLGLERD